ncbi:MAG: dienelactone hydrolase family protein [Rhodospirillales bacterium]|nr:dienelactone hydrolase family protein [Rhodospirillales bacterium]MCB9995130.1 dienelactone hydrolase family protein [Rhodospirillales bacterium]
MRRFLLSAAFLFTATISAPAIAGENVTYQDGDTVLEGYWAPSSCAETVPSQIVMIVHQWKGLGDYEKGRADQLAGLCYDAFAIDMYGKDIRPETREDAARQSSLYKDDPDLARNRLKAALSFARQKAGKETAPVAVMGYCFGGTMALELARSGADIKGAISFHGGLSTKKPVTEPGIITASVQVHHGAADPYVPQADVDTFMQEMDAANADWILTQYAGAVHAFTEKEAGDDPSTGVAYNEKADKRSWDATIGFLEEIF